MDLRNPFGLRDGQIIMIEDIPKSKKGLRCNCVCPACKEPFEARMGDRRRHHFAHSGQGCDELNAYMAGLYMLLKEYLTNPNELYLPPVIVSFEFSAYFYLNDDNIEEHVRLQSWSCDESHEEIAHKEKTVEFDSAEIIESSKGKPEAIIAVKKGRRLAIKIVPPDTVCKTGKVSKYKDFPTLEVDLSLVGDLIQESRKEDIFKYLTDKKSIYRWIYNPIMKKTYDNIKKRTKAYYEKSQANMKKEEEQRKEQEALQRAESEKRAKENAERQRIGAENRKKEYDEYLKRQADEVKKREEIEKIERKRREQMEKELRKKRYDVGYSDVKDLFTQNTTKINDRYGVRWIKCEECGCIKPEADFSMWGGQEKVNLGTCTECIRKNNS
ncbi:MAG: hypothetical protein K2M82_01590 [Lachnospiraceae bacterium]|nr:hypothetical protein [Lachnospiraceae bacterium]